MGFEIFLKICSMCVYFVVLIRKVVPLIQLHFLSNMSLHNTSPYILITTPFGPCASNIFVVLVMRSMLQSHRTNLSIDMYHRLKHVDFPMFYRIFIQFHHFL